VKLHESCCVAEALSLSGACDVGALIVSQRQVRVRVVPLVTATSGALE
jgi:hypothetical protein